MVSKRVPAVGLLVAENSHAHTTAHQHGRGCAMSGLQHGQPPGGANPGSQGELGSIDVRWAQRCVLPSEPCQFIPGKHMRC